ncbi:MAG: hypothetical protein O3B73_04660 [bacterium]|nr:hypothetical protein [bacterium]
MTLGERLKTCTAVAAQDNGPTVVSTVADELCALLSSEARRYPVPPGQNAISIGLADSELIEGPRPLPDKDWAFFRFANGRGELSASAPHLLYPLLCRLRDDWLDEPADAFEAGRTLQAQFRWLAGRDEFLTGRLGFSKRRNQVVGPEDLENGMRELARLGCTHVVINELARRSAESGPIGEVYYRFYDYTPDIDQYVETKLNVGTYPREYLQANLSLLQSQSKLADKYGLIPGLYAAHPRSVPDTLLKKYPFLRGARIDHTFRSYEPRYTLSVAHPAVRWHYAQLVRTLLTEVPELGFIKMLLNDSGAGFEYTASLYPGRNGGPYIVREWRPDSEIARLAAENVIRYYRMLRDAAREVNPDFHLMTGLKNIAEEQDPILAGMDSGIDLQTQSQRADVNDPEWQTTRAKLQERGAYVLSDTNATGSSYVLGVPSPWVIFDRLQKELTRGFDRVDVYMNPVYMAPWDINREVVAAFQSGEGSIDVDALTRRAAERWVGPQSADTLVTVWRLADEAVRHAPIHFLYGWLGFTWYRFWVRPFVPDIAAIPEADRAYYQEPMLTVFNNPHNIDFAADALWKLHTVEGCDRDIGQFDTAVWPCLERAIALAKTEAQAGHAVWIDVRDRLRAFRCYAETMRNICAWIAGVHGYLEAPTEADKARRHQLLDEMASREVANCRDLLALWETSDTDFMPIQIYGESVHHYGTNFGALLQKKIALMETYRTREPRIDRDYMFRAPPGFPVSESDYLAY